MCGGVLPWESEHTAVARVGLSTLLVVWSSRHRGPRSGRMLAVRHVAPVLGASIVALLATHALIMPLGSCAHFSLAPVPWWSGWTMYVSYAVSVSLALIGTRS